MRMQRKVALCIAALIVGYCAMVSADAQFRMALAVGTDFAERPSYQDIGAGFNDPANVFEGLHLEVITDRIVGFGIDGLVRFTETATNGIDESAAWWFDWNGRLFVSAHFFGGGAIVDPFVEIGYGCVGRVNLSYARSGVWSEDEAGLWRYEWYDTNDEGLTNISLFPVVSAGVAFDLAGFLIGARIAYRPIVHVVPGTRVENYPLTQFHIGLFGGVALGGHR